MTKPVPVYRFEYACGHVRLERSGFRAPASGRCPDCEAEASRSSEGVVTWDGFEGALLGVLRCPDGIERAVYSVTHMRRVLETRDGMEPEEAEEYLQFNTLGAYVGPATPLHVEWTWPLELIPAGPKAGEP